MSLRPTLNKKNISTSQDLHVSAPVVFGNDYNISLECQVPEHMVLDGSFQAVTKEPAQQVNANPQMGFHLREYTSADYTQEITKYPVQVSINKEIFLEVTLADETSRNTTLGVKVNECRATPSPDPHDSTSYQLIRDSCPATPAVHLQSSPSPETYRFSVQTFHFSGNTNNDDVVYIHCDVSICHDDKCGLRCGASGGARRKRRSRLSKRSALGSTLTSGPHIIVNESETKQ
ncbi:uromodulin [Biomphalaria glabrata]